MTVTKILMLQDTTIRHVCVFSIPSIGLVNNNQKIKIICKILQDNILGNNTVNSAIKRLLIKKWKITLWCYITFSVNNRL